MADGRTIVMGVRLSPAERERIRAAADAEGLPPTIWVRRAALIEARRIEGVQGRGERVEGPR